jgi:hypothetical protein
LLAGVILAELVDRLDFFLQYLVETRYNVRMFRQDRRSILNPMQRLGRKRQTPRPAIPSNVAELLSLTLRLATRKDGPFRKVHLPGQQRSPHHERGTWDTAEPETGENVRCRLGKKKLTSEAACGYQQEEKTVHKVHTPG